MTFGEKVHWGASNLGMLYEGKLIIKYDMYNASA